MVKNDQKKGQNKSSGGFFGLLPFVIACSLVIAGCLTLGDSTLWMTNDEASHHEQGAEDESEDSDQAADQTSNTPSSATQDMDTKDADTAVVVSEYKAISQSSDSRRTTNLRLASEAIDGKVIQPGETFSFNAVVGDTENDNRYEIASVADANKLADGRGGGICQVSTALYIAALKANFKIDERHPHTLASDYAPIGLDSTLVYGSMDLRFTNTSDYPVEIDASAVGQTVDVKLKGHESEPGVTIDAVSKITERLEGGQVPQTLKNGTPTDGNVVYVVESYRVYYKNGVKTSSEMLSSDTYIVPDTSSAQLTEGGSEPTK